MIENFPPTPPLASRRTILKTLAGTALSTVASLSELRPEEAGSDRYWQEVKRQFALARDLVMVNAANLCPCPVPVLSQWVSGIRDVDADPSGQNRQKFKKLRELSRLSVARHLGVDGSEIALLRNTSEANNVIASGLDLKAADEVVIWDQNHATNKDAWKVRARRFGFTVREVATPPGPASRAQLVEPFQAALTGKTRVLALTHVSNLTGVALPVAELCGLARERGILTLVDGAQTFGALRLDLRQMDCDFFTGSAHKWFMGPREVGVLYVRDGLAERVWPLTVGVGWEQAHDQGALRFETLGQRDDAAISALAAAVDFHEKIGAGRVEQRVRALASRLFERLSRLPRATMITPSARELRAGVVVFSLAGVDPVEAVRRLYEDRRIGSAAMTTFRPGIRFSPHVFNTDQDLDRVLGAVDELFG